MKLLERKSAETNNQLKVDIKLFSQHGWCHRNRCVFVYKSYTEFYVYKIGLVSESSDRTILVKTLKNDSSIVKHL